MSVCDYLKTIQVKCFCLKIGPSYTHRNILMCLEYHHRINSCIDLRRSKGAYFKCVYFSLNVYY